MIGSLSAKSLGVAAGSVGLALVLGLTIALRYSHTPEPPAGPQLPVREEARPPALPDDEARFPTAPAADAVADTEPQEAPRQIALDVRGAVQAPGLYWFDPRARVQDAIDAGGGLTPDADLSDINLAAFLVDGTALAVPAQPIAGQTADGLVARGSATAAELNPACYTRSGWTPPVCPAPAAQAADTPADALPDEGALINLNSAPQATLESLPGIGPKTAEKIIAYREQNPFQSVDDLQNVPGIGPKKLETVRPLVTVDGR